MNFSILDALNWYSLPYIVFQPETLVSTRRQYWTYDNETATLVRLLRFRLGLDGYLLRYDTRNYLGLTPQVIS